MASKPGTSTHPAKKATTRTAKARPAKASPTATPAAPPKAPQAAPASPVSAARKRGSAGKTVGLIAQAQPKPGKLKAKLVRDSFTMPQADFDLIALLKSRALGFRRPTKKSELLRAGLQVLAGLDSAALAKALGALAPLKVGRPKKDS